MPSMNRVLILAAVGAVLMFVPAHPGASGAGQGPAEATTRRIDLGAELTAKHLRSSGRSAAPVADRPGAVRVSAGDGPGVVWIEGTDFGLGTVELDVRGKDAPNESFLGVAFHRADDATYEDVYLRPFNFRATDPARHQHAIQYESMPRNPWMVLRQTSPEEFENPVDASIDPNNWVSLRLVIDAGRIRAFAGSASVPALEVRRLSQANQGQVGLWVGNTSDGDFANLRLTTAK
jgi:hypothetical protein